MKIQRRSLTLSRILINMKLLPKDKPKRYLDYIVGTKRDKFNKQLFTIRIVYMKRSICYVNLSRIIKIRGYKLSHITSIEITDRECLQLYELFDDLEEMKKDEIGIST